MNPRFDVNIGNYVQMAVCAALALYISLGASSRPSWFLASLYLASGYMSFFLGSLFWTLHLALLGATPARFSASDIAWISWFAFVYMTERELQRRPTRPSAWAWIFLFAGLANCVALSLRYGSWFLNALWRLPMCLVLWHTGCVIAAAKAPRMSALYASILGMLALEFTLFWSHGAAYIVVDALCTLSLIAIGLRFQAAKAMGAS